MGVISPTVSALCRVPRTIAFRPFIALALSSIALSEDDAGKNNFSRFVALQSTEAHSGFSGAQETLTGVGKSSTQ